MLGPLPKLYRVAVGVAALVLFVAAGAWAAFVIPYPILVSVGASVGLAFGALCAFLLLRDAHRTPQASPARRPHLH